MTDQYPNEILDLPGNPLDRSGVLGYYQGRPFTKADLLDMTTEEYRQFTQSFQQQRYILPRQYGKAEPILMSDEEWRLLRFGPPKKSRKDTMLDKILRLYTAAMAGDVRSPLVHIVGPPGCGKSESVEQAAELLEVGLHVVNVSRISPLELEGVQMPVNNNTELKMLTATWWSNLREGDIVLFDEFLRGFPEVYNGLLDILTARRVGNFDLPKVFFIAASNSTSAYDKALEDRLLHLIVPDARKLKSERSRMAKLLVEATGMLPDMMTVFQMDDLLKEEVLPTYDMLDVFMGKPNVSASSIRGHSLRHLIGQVRLRQIQATSLKELLAANNRAAMSKSLYQYVVLPDGKNPDPLYVQRARALVGNDKLTDVQAQNLSLNIQLIEMEEALHEVIDTKEDDTDDPLS